MFELENDSHFSVAFTFLPIKEQTKITEMQANESLMTTECDSTNTVEETIEICVD